MNIMNTNKTIDSQPPPLLLTNPVFINLHTSSSSGESSFRHPNHQDPNHHQLHQHQCQECEWSSRYSYNVKRHYRKQHWGQLRFECEYCVAVLGWSRKALKNHMDRTHRAQEVPCDQCSYRGYSEEIVYAHRVAVHEKRYNPYSRVECHQCGGYYTSKRGLDRHILRVHMGVKGPKPITSEGSWPCGLGPKSFGRKRYLNSHMKNYHHAY
jgi:hypothetical protein